MFLFYTSKVLAFKVWLTPKVKMKKTDVTFIPLSLKDTMPASTCITKSTLIEPFKELLQELLQVYNR